MVNADLIRDLVAPYKKEYGTVYLEELFKSKSIDIIKIPMGCEEGSLKGLIMKNSRMYTVVINSDLSIDGMKIVLVHELGHYLYGHLKGARVARLWDNQFGYRGYADLTARKENEANFIVADYILNDEETMDIISSYDVLTSAAILRVPVEILDFKLRLLHQRNRLAHYVDCVNAKSDFLKNAHLADPFKWW